jgi:hypothetical protein
MQSFPPVGWHRQPNKQLVWNMVKEREKREREKAKEEEEQKQSKKTPLLRFSKYNSAIVPIDSTNLLMLNTEFSVVRGVYAYGEPQDKRTCEWFVNFADKHLFGFYASPLFAQDEWQCLEHPSLCSLREFLERAGEKNPSAKPLTVTKFQRGPQPTPCLIMNAPREVEIDAVGQDIYGNKFDEATEKKVAQATKLVQPRTRSNIIAMEALKHGRGAYTVNQICIILQTAIASFIGAKCETWQEFKDTNTFVKEAPPRVVIHTGNWGCGAFGGNIELMCLLQLISARIAGVDELVYHAISKENEDTCKKAEEDLEELLLEVNKEAAEGSQCTRREGARRGAATLRV